MGSVSSGDRHDEPSILTRLALLCFPHLFFVTLGISYRSIVASSITTSKRASPIASSLKAEIDHLESTAKKGGGAWLLLQADDESQAKDLLKHLKVDQVFDLEKATLQAIHLQQEAEAGGPLYDVSSDSNSNSNLNKSENVANEDRSREGDAPETVFGDKTTGGDAEAGKEKSKDESTGGHSVETAGPLYGK